MEPTDCIERPDVSLAKNKNKNKNPKQKQWKSTTTLSTSPMPPTTTKKMAKLLGRVTVAAFACRYLPTRMDKFLLLPFPQMLTPLQITVRPLHGTCHPPTSCLYALPAFHSGKVCSLEMRHRCNDDSPLFTLGFHGEDRHAPYSWGGWERHLLLPDSGQPQAPSAPLDVIPFSRRD